MTEEKCIKTMYELEGYSKNMSFHYRVIKKTKQIKNNNNAGFSTPSIHQLPYCVFPLPLYHLSLPIPVLFTPLSLPLHGATQASSKFPPLSLIVCLSLSSNLPIHLSTFSFLLAHSLC